MCSGVLPTTTFMIFLIATYIGKAAIGVRLCVGDQFDLISSAHASESYFILMKPELKVGVGRGWADREGK